jgi:hypothetical protein
VGLAEGHDLGPAIVTVAADGDVGIGPVPTDMAHEEPDVTLRFGTRRCLAGAQQHGDRAASSGVIDVDREEAALAMVTVSERKLMIAVDNMQVSSISSVTAMGGTG